MPVRPAPTLAELLAQVDGDAGGDPDGHRDADQVVAAIADVGQMVDHAARAAAGVGGWTPEEPLRLAKHRVTWLLRCPRRALAPPEAVMTDDLVAGLVVDAAAKLATLVPQRAPTVDAALDFLAATGDTSVAEHLADRGGRDTLPPDVGARVDALAGAWPQVDAGWWPRVEEPVRATLAGGAAVVSGRLDLLLGGPPTGRPSVIVEVKAGRWHDGARADGHLYALLVALRDSWPPAAVVTVVADGTTQVEPIRPAVLTSAADRVVHALEVAAPIAAGEPAAANPGPHCGHCPLRPDCPEGTAWRPTTDSPGEAAPRPASS